MCTKFACGAYRDSCGLLSSAPFSPIRGLSESSNRGVIRVAKKPAIQRIKELDEERAHLLKEARDEVLKLRKEIDFSGAKNITGDRLALALISVFRTLVGEWSKKGVFSQKEVVTSIQETETLHRQAGDPNNLADAIHTLGLLFQGAPHSR
jgi:hypothetical protein